MRVSQLEPRNLLSHASIVYDPISHLVGSSRPGVGMDSGGGSGQFAATNNLTYQGGPLIQNIQIEPIFLKDGASGNQDSPAFQAGIDAFFNTITSDSYIPSQLSQYSVGANVNGLGNPAYTIGTGSKGADDNSPVFTPTRTDQGYPSIDDSDIINIIDNEIIAGRTAPVSSNTLYVMFTPPGDAVTSGSSDSISYFLGYHSAYVSSVNAVVYYAVIPDESAPPNANLGAGWGLTALQGEEQVCSHEMSEAITDPVPPSGWYSEKDGGEVGDLAANESYMLDGNQVQYEWSNAMLGPVHAPGTVGQSNLFINQLSPPAVDSFINGPVGTFTDPSLPNDPSGFTAYAFAFDLTHGFSGFWNTSISGGANGIYTVSAAPGYTLADGTVGGINQQTGMYLFVYPGSNVPFGTVTGNGLAIRYQPFTVSTAAPMTYNADNGLMSANGDLSHSFRLVKDASRNFDLYDNGQLVFSQPAAHTSSIVIAADPNGVDSSLTIDYSGGAIATPVTFDGGTGTGIHTLTGPNAANNWTISGANAGTVGSVTFSHVDSLVGGRNPDIFKFLPGGSLSGTINGGTGPNTLDYSGNGGMAVTVNLQSDATPDINGGNAGGFSNINALVGSTGSDTLVGPNRVNTWNITGPDAGKIGIVNFQSFENLVGGTNVDTFKFTTAGSVATVAGGGAPNGQGDWLDFSLFPSTVGVTANLTTGQASWTVGTTVQNLTVGGIQNIMGGAGNDTLIGGSQGNILIGSGGNDTITGGTGRSILIGGQGSDTVTGGSGGDIIIGGYTTYDSNNHNALMVILAEWQSTDSYATRTSRIRSGHILGHNGIKLAAGSTVADDGGAADMLTGGAPVNSGELDWFFQFAGDTINNQEAGEAVN